MSAALPADLAGFRGFHNGETAVVCGCGESLAGFHEPRRWITIGVNDVGRLFDPTYLVVLNPRSQFKGDRFGYVERSRARAIFTQLDLRLDHPHVVRFQLGRRGGTGDGGGPGTLDYASNSPYVALMLALHMGAARIGLIGVDFTDNHFFGPTGKHPLQRRLAQIDAEYSRVLAAARARGVEIVNLSACSRLTAFPKSGFGGTPLPGVPSKPAPLREVSSMNLAVEQRSGPVIGAFLDTFARTAADAGLHVERIGSGGAPSRGRLVVCWNGRQLRGPQPAIYCEHGWLPRWDYQVSAKGINADSHLAPFVWDGRAPDAASQGELDRRLAEIRRGRPGDAVHTPCQATPSADLPEEYLLAPLQIEQDTNIVRHAPRGLRTMQRFVDAVAGANPPLPVIFKQHPADGRHGNRHLRLAMRRKQDLLRRHDDGNIHQLLASGRCRGVLSINSNAVHDALLWNVPAAVLGRNVWPQDGMGPFLNGLPTEWADVFTLWEDPRRRDCRDSYALHLIRNQWTLEDAGNPAKVERIVRDAGGAARPAVRTFVPRAPRAGGAKPPRVNVVAANRGWLFEDLKRHFLSARLPEARILVSERPRRDADAWIYLRAREAVSSPGPARTIVQLHDLEGPEAYAAGGERAAAVQCGGLVLTHPAQREILVRAGARLEGKAVLCRPMGALRSFTLRERLPERFSAGWAGRPARRGADDPNRPRWIAETLAGLPGVRAILLGERLEATAQELEAAGIETALHPRRLNPIGVYPRRYHEMDCLLVTGREATGPNALFEALACGLPVVSTRVGWAPELIREAENGFFGDTPAELAAGIARIQDQRRDWFARRERIRESLGGWSLESWIERNVELAVELAKGGRQVLAAAG